MSGLVAHSQTVRLDCAVPLNSLAVRNYNYLDGENSGEKTLATQDYTQCQRENCTRDSYTITKSCLREAPLVHNFESDILVTPHLTVLT